MPFATFKAVREVSSEDSNHQAENLLKQTGKKWKTKTPGEKMAHVILELEEPQQIVGIDIGNEHSAFVEVLVGKSANEFTEILITCSFMTPIESRNSTNPNRVRCFNQDALVSTAVPHKWRYVKIVCTQPFNKHVQYGVSFIKLHVTESAKKESTHKSLVPEQFLRKVSTDSNESQSAKVPNFGRFKLREDSPDSESESSTALFSRWKAAHGGGGGTPQSKLSTAAAIREASTPQGLRRLSAEHKNATVKPVPRESKQSSNETSEQVRDRNRTDLLFGDDEDDEMQAHSSKNQRLEKQIELEREHLKRENEKIQEKQKRKSRDSLSPVAHKKNNDLNSTHSKGKTPKRDDLNNSSSSKAKTPQSQQQTTRNKRASSPTSKPGKKAKLASERQYKPFKELLRGVVLVISGIQNPDRADLRSKALALGAKYKTDWESGCTHLICAFKNTPKYNQVKGKGKIVTRSWIEQCYKLKKYLPWRRYALDSADLGQSESDEEIWDETLRPTTSISSDVDDDEGDVVMVETEAPSTSAASRKEDTIVIDDLEACEQQEMRELTSGSDTEDEIARVQEKGKQTPKQQKIDKDVYEVTTDEEDYLQDKLKMCADAAKVY